MFGLFSQLTAKWHLIDQLDFGNGKASNRFVYQKNFYFAFNAVWNIYFKVNENVLRVFIYIFIY